MNRPSAISSRFVAALLWTQVLLAGCLLLASWLPARAFAPGSFLASSAALGAFAVWVLWPASFDRRGGYGVEACVWAALFAPWLVFGARFAAEDGGLAPALLWLAADLVLLAGLGRLCRTRPRGRRAVLVAVVTAGVLWPALATAAADLELVRLPARFELLWLRDATAWPRGAAWAWWGGELLLGLLLWLPGRGPRAVGLAAAGLLALCLGAGGEAAPALRVELRSLLDGSFRPGEGAGMLVDIETETRVHGALLVSEGESSYGLPLDLPAGARRTLTLPFVPQGHLGELAYAFLPAGASQALPVRPRTAPRWESLNPNQSLLGLCGMPCPEVLRAERQVRVEAAELRHDPAGWLLGGLDVLLCGAEPGRALPRGVEAWVARGGLVLVFAEVGALLEGRLGADFPWRDTSLPGLREAPSGLGAYLRYAGTGGEELRSWLSARVRVARQRRTLRAKRMYLAWRGLLREGALPQPLPASFAGALPVLAALLLAATALIALAGRARLRTATCAAGLGALGLISCLVWAATLPAGWATVSEARVRVSSAGRPGAVDFLAFACNPDRVERPLAVELPPGLVSPVLARASDHAAEPLRAAPGRLAFPLDAPSLFVARDALAVPSGIVLARAGDTARVVHRGPVAYDSAFVRLGPRLYPLGPLAPGETATVALRGGRPLFAADSFEAAWRRHVLLTVCGPKQLCLLGYPPLEAVDLGLPGWLAERRAAAPLHISLE